MKKILILMLTLSLIITFTACKNGDFGVVVGVTSFDDTTTPIPEDNSTEQTLDNEEPKTYTPHEMTDEQKHHYDKYVSPLLLSGMLTTNWDSENISEFLHPKMGLMYAYEDIMGQNHMISLWDKHGVDLPRQEIEGILTEIFPFSEEKIREILSEIYDSEKQIYCYEGGRGGGPMDAYVSEISNNDDGSVSLDYSILTIWNNDNQAYDHIYHGTLTLMITENSYQYISVEAK